VEPNHASLASRLKALRRESGKSQETLARELGISRSCLANYENGTRMPDCDMLIRIANLFHVLTDYLIMRTDHRSPELSMDELNETIRLKNYIKAYEAGLDITKLAPEGQMILLNYYSYLRAKSHQHGEAAPIPKCQSTSSK